MANNKLSELTISFVKRNSRYNGPTSSEVWNDSVDELSRDLVNLFDQWNNYLFPLVNSLTEDAFKDGLDARSLYVNAEANSNDDIYWNVGQARPNTLYEQLQNLYLYIDNEILEVQNQLSNNGLSAIDIPIADVGNVFIATNVEDALSELKDNFSASSDHGSLDGLNDDDHTQYVLVNGDRALTGSLNLGGNAVTNATKNVVEYNLVDTDEVTASFKSGDYIFVTLTGSTAEAVLIVPPPVENGVVLEIQALVDDTCHLWIAGSPASSPALNIRNFGNGVIDYFDLLSSDAPDSLSDVISLFSWNGQWFLKHDVGNWGSSQW